MAGEWLKLESATPEKPEVLALTVKMGWDDPDLTVGKLFRVWRWFDQQTIDGNAAGVTCALLDRIASATGFAQSMIEVGWLVDTGRGLSLPNFDKHNGVTAKSRAQTAKRVANHRKTEQAENKSNAQTVTPALAREEKKREEVIDTPIPPEGAEDPKQTGKGKAAISLQTYLAECKAKGVKPIPEDCSVFNYAKESGIPDEFLRLHWFEFRDRYCVEGAKRYKSWTAAFTKSVRGNWFRLWYFDDRANTYALSTTGVQARNTHKGKS
jgi:hypothetical protein